MRINIIIVIIRNQELRSIAQVTERFDEDNLNHK